VRDLIQNGLMTVLLFPLSMFLIGIYARFNGPFDKKFYWMVVVAAYFVMLFVCWGVETGYLKQMILG